MNKKITILAVAVLIVLIAVGVGSQKFNSDKKEVLTIEEAKTKAQDFINNTLVAEGTDINITGISEESGAYKLTLDIDGKEMEAYISKDGKKFFPSPIDIAGTESKVAEQKEEDGKEAPKTDKPQVDLYVMSFCPYGNKAEDTLKPVYEILKDKVNFNFHYIVSSDGETINSLHGEPEVVQNEREACVMRDYGKDAWMNFAAYVNDNCGSDGNCWEDGAKNLSLDTVKISACVTSDGVSLMKANEEASNQAGASGSPTMLINGVKTKTVYQYGDSESYKQEICKAFNDMPEECNQVLDSETSTTSGGSCGS